MEMMKRKGFALTVDAVIAMSFILVIALALSAQRFSNISESTELAFVNLHYVSEDALDVMNKQGILDQIGEFWTSNNTTAANDLARLYLDDIIPQNTGYKLWIYNNTSVMGYTTLAENARVAEQDAIAQTYSLRFLVGYQKGTPVLSSVSRAFLTGIESKTSSAYAYFGGFEGQGNLTKYLYLPDDATIQSAYMEMDAGSQFVLRVNGAGCGTYTPSGGYLSADVQEDISGCNFNNGKNTLEIRFTGNNFTDQFIGGGFIRVTYNTTELNESALTGSGMHEFPGIDGLMNYYGSFYVPGTLTSMAAHLVFQNNYTTFLRIGDEQVYTSSGSPSTQTVDLDDAFLQSRLNYNDISGKTIPLRLGTSNISSIIQEGNADVVLITDLSGSMNWRLDNDNSGTQRSCTDSNLLSSSTKRVSLAKCLDKQFVNIILNNSGNYVALVGFAGEPLGAEFGYNLDFSSSNTTLINKINTYPDSPSGGTCICCAINKAYEMLAGRETLVDEGESWKYLSYTASTYDLIPDGDDNWKFTSYSSCGDSCNPAAGSPAIPGSCTPANWQTLSFDDAPWGTANLPKSNNNEQNTVFYYRRHFTVPSTAFSSATLRLNNRRGVQCYLANSLYPNGYYINTDTSCRTGNYWDNQWTISSSRFVAGSDNVLTCRVRSGMGSSRRGIEFDAELVINTPCGDSCDPSTTPGFCTPSNWQATGFNDSSWATYDLPKENADEQYSVFYYRKHFTLSQEANSSGFLSLRNRRGVQCYINGNLINTDTSCSTGNYWDNIWSFPASYFNDPGEDNVIACRVRSGAGSSRNGIEFDARLTTPSSRNKFIIVMSDGVTGYHCGVPPSYTPPSTSTTAPSNDYVCDGNQVDCSGNQCNPAINNAIWSSQRAHTNLSTTLHSIGFGPVASCTNGRYTLEQIAAVGNGSYCASTNATQLRDCYVQFANDILTASIRSQIVNITGSATISTLSPDSYISYTYTPNVPQLEYGEITLSYDTDRFNNNATCTGSFYIPPSVSVIDAKATSYSSEHWTDYLEVNSNKVYDLSDYMTGSIKYFDLGDPYTVYMDPANIPSGQNSTVYVRTGDSPTNHTGCSPDNRAILTIKMSGGVGYGDTFPKAEGCNWEIDFESAPSEIVKIPSSYNGTASCKYKYGDINVTSDDALNDAVYRVLQKLDLDDDGELDIKLDPNQMEIESSRIGGVRSLYGPVQFKLVVWI